ncbi:MAG: hypothetical protein WCA46_27730 [Actinocatenispora sp.]
MPAGAGKDDPVARAGNRRRLARDAEIVGGAVVRAERLRFRVTPDTSVEFPGDERNESADGSTRQNLPPAVRPGITYHDIRVGYVLASRVDTDAVLDDVEYTVDRPT